MGGKARDAWTSRSAWPRQEIPSARGMVASFPGYGLMQVSAIGDPKIPQVFWASQRPPTLCLRLLTTFPTFTISPIPSPLFRDPGPPRRLVRGVLWMRTKCSTSNSATVGRRVRHLKYVFAFGRPRASFNLLVVRNSGAAVLGKSGKHCSY